MLGWSHEMSYFLFQAGQKTGSLLLQSRCQQTLGSSRSVSQPVNRKQRRWSLSERKKSEVRQEWFERKGGVYGAIFNQVQYMLALIARWSAERFIKMPEILVLPTLPVARWQQSRFWQGHTELQSGQGWETPDWAEAAQGEQVAAETLHCAQLSLALPWDFWKWGRCFTGLFCTLSPSS